MRWIALLILAMIVGACEMRDPYVLMMNSKSSGKWEIEKTIDRVTGAPTPNAYVTSTRASNSNDTQVEAATIYLTCFEKIPIVRIKFDFKVGGDAHAALGYRFDDKPGHDDVPSRVLPGQQVIVIEDKAEVARFVSELVASTALVVRVRSITAGRTIADFQVEGGQGAIDAGFASCPVTAIEPARSAKL